MVGLTALLALLHHSHFYQEMLVVFTNFYAQPTIQHVSAADLMMSSQLSSASSESTMSTTGEQTQCTGTLIYKHGQIIEEFSKTGFFLFDIFFFIFQLILLL